MEVFIISNFIDLIGQKFGRLIVLERTKNDKRGRAYWICKCTCGKISTVDGTKLRSGHTKSCGCLSKELFKERATTHGMCKTSEYITWRGILARCFNPDELAFKYYGGRGITVCDKWKNDFMAFFNYIGSRPSPIYSIDRIDNDGNYEPGNIRWATPKEQSINRRSVYKITIDNISLAATQWAEISQVPSFTILRRIKKGWSCKKAVFQPPRKMNKRKLSHYNSP